MAANFTRNTYYNVPIFLEQVTAQTAAKGMLAIFRLSSTNNGRITSS